MVAPKLIAPKTKENFQRVCMSMMLCSKFVVKTSATSTENDENRETGSFTSTDRSSGRNRFNIGPDDEGMLRLSFRDSSKGGAQVYLPGPELDILEIYMDADDAEPTHMFRNFGDWFCVSGFVQG